MRLNTNDPRLTAYALGELEEKERREVEEQVKADRALAAEVEEIRAFSAMLSKELAAEPLPEPRAGVRKALPWLRIGFGTSLATAAVGLLVFLNVREEATQTIAPVFKADNKKIIRLEESAPVADEARDFESQAPAAPEMSLARRKSGPAVGGTATSYGVAPAKPLLQAQPAAEGAPADDIAFNTESYSRFDDNPFIGVGEDPRSTFSIDVDTASYANMRRFLTSGGLPPKDSVRIEEMVNYFTYDYPQPKDGHPFSVNVEVNEAPWNREHRLVRIGLKGKEIPWEKRPATNLVFLVDTSGSMQDANKLPLVKSSLELLIEKLEARDRVAIVVYAGSAGLVLPSTPGSEKKKILEALQRLEAGGSTNGGAGIELAYKTARENFIKGGINRVIIASDGDFNVGVTSEGELTRLIERKAASGIFLSVLGYGLGNYKDSTMEKLADKGNGNYAYVDTLNEAKKVMGRELVGTLFTIAKDVKIQIEFNPAQVSAYRLIGYENRVLAHQDFNDDKKDAGDIGSGHTVTALYEIVPKGKKLNIPGVDALKYQTDNKLTTAAESGELMTIKLRYKQPEAEKSELLTQAVTDSSATLSSASEDFRFAAAVASFGMILRDSKWKGSSTFDGVLDLAGSAKGRDESGYRSEFLDLVRKAKAIGQPK